MTERGTNSISSFAVDDEGYADGPTTIPSAGATPYGFDFTATGALIVTEAGIRDEALTPDGRFLYAIDTDAQRLFGWTVEADGRLSPVGEFEGVPETVAGLAAH